VIVDHLKAPAQSRLLGQRSQCVRSEGGLNHNNGLTDPYHLDLKVPVSDRDQHQMIHPVIFTTQGRGGNQKSVSERIVLHFLRHVNVLAPRDIRLLARRGG
jgi:hypothetical protein